MQITIPKGTSLQKVRTLLKTLSGRKKHAKSIGAFFGKIPDIYDGLIYQKQTRSEWNKKITSVKLVGDKFELIKYSRL
jgi:hypothetical protein